MMPSTTWIKAVEKQETRRLLGRQSNLQDLIVNGLDEMVDGLTPDKQPGARNSDTTAVGYLPASVARHEGDFLLFVVFKGSKHMDSETILAKVPSDWGKGTVIFVPNWYQEKGTHAEVQILMYLQSLGHDIAGLSAKGLRIACGSKGCCPDCAGFLAKQGIPHTRARDNVAAYWRHPRTEAFYSGTGDNLLYSKLKTTGTDYVSKQRPDVSV